MGDKTVSQEINILRKKIKDLEAQRVKLKFLIEEHRNKAETLRNMIWAPNFVNGTDELHFNKWKSFSIAANKKALNELNRQSKTTIHQLKKIQKELTQLQGVQ
jgi:predicted RNase H-like nuclease (RuvC/YqgF family)